MGYYTQYSIEFSNADEKTKSEIIKQLREYSDEQYLFDYDNCDETKWYDHINDCIKVSKAHPDVVFIIRGEGGDRYDNWRRKYHNGNVSLSKGVIIFLDFETENVNN